MKTKINTSFGTSRKENGYQSKDLKTTRGQEIKKLLPYIHNKVMTCSEVADICGSSIPYVRFLYYENRHKLTEWEYNPNPAPILTVGDWKTMTPEQKKAYE